MKNEIILSSRLSFDDIISRKIDHLIRINDKNKWTKNSIFSLKPSHISLLSIDIIILSSELVKIQDITIETLNRCGYNSQSEFKEQWENWFKEWNEDSIAWLIYFNIIDKQEFTPISINNDMYV